MTNGKMTFENFDRQALSGEGSWIGSSAMALHEMVRLNAYIEAAEYERVSETTIPSVMIVGIVRTGLFERPFPIPHMVEDRHSPLEASNHEESFRDLCENINVRAFRSHSFWLGFVIANDSVQANKAQSYHLALNTYGDIDGLRPRRRRNIATQLVSGLGQLGACVVIESPDSVFDARTGKSITSYEAGIDFSVPW